MSYSIIQSNQLTPSILMRAEICALSFLMVRTWLDHTLKRIIDEDHRNEIDEIGGKESVTEDGQRKAIRKHRLSMKGKNLRKRNDSGVEKSVNEDQQRRRRIKKEESTTR
ncbi:hypothetical protein WA026_000907 [Henosepilachna vigintioctopunctata]|uniref:Uncharacterized protein n=1 Tax=Henosepilachna vigintioctopunctata TaxID=420089 RepID=A0AAW1V8P3_9CUCU